MVLEFLMYKFGIRALIGGLIVAVTCASLGVFIVLRRLSLIADGLGHVAFGGIALGFWTGIYPLYTAVASVIAGSLGIHALGRLRVASDAAIAIMFSAGLAIGVVLISLAQSAPADLLSYLFGTILGINDNDVILAACLGIIVLVLLSLLWKEWIAITLDPDFARVAGMPVSILEILFTILVGLTVVVSYTSCRCAPCVKLDGHTGNSSNPAPAPFPQDRICSAVYGNYFSHCWAPALLFV